jgi:transcription termination factor Rho
MADEPRDLIQTEFEDNPAGKSPSPAKKTAPKKKAVKAAAKKTAKKEAAKKAAKKAPAKKAVARKKTVKKPEVAEGKEEVAEQEKAPSEETPPPKATQKTAKKAGKKAAARKILAVPEGMKASKEKEEPTLEVVEEKHPSDLKEDIPRRNGRPMGRVKGGPVGKAAQGKQDRSKEDRRNPKHRDDESGGNKGAKFQGDPYEVSGLLETTPKGFGFLREADGNYEQAKSDVFVAPDLIQEHALRVGQVLTGKAQKGPRGPQLVELDTINGSKPEEAKSFPHFEELKAIFPDKRIGLETTPERFTTRVLDILAPVGRGQRGLIVSPPRAGKTTLLLHIAEAVQELHSETMHLMVCLVDERPEEVTEFRRQLPDAEIYASSNDEPARNHCRLAELCIERAKRLVEAGQHVFLVMDSITRLARAYNNTMGGSKKGRGRGIQSGGIMTGALEEPRRLFAAARNTREAGSLTILGTALVQTNSKADEAIFMEFKGTGNMELVLDRRIAEHFVYPAVDLFKSGTRREELLLPEHTLTKINLIRRGLAGHRPIEAMERLLFFLKKFPNNAQMLMEIKG